MPVNTGVHRGEYVMFGFLFRKFQTSTEARLLADLKLAAVGHSEIPGVL